MKKESKFNIKKFSKISKIKIIKNQIKKIKILENIAKFFKPIKLFVNNFNLYFTYSNEFKKKTTKDIRK